MDGLYECLENFSASVINVINDHVNRPVSNDSNFVNNEVDTVNNSVNSDVDRTRGDVVELGVLQAVIEDWAKEALKTLIQIFEANGENTGFFKHLLQFTLAKKSYVARTEPSSKSLPWY